MEIIDMKQGHFYFISDEFFTRFDPNGLLMRNKEGNRSRPCYFVFPDKTEPEIFWCVPISSKVEKYEGIVQKKLEKQERNGNDHPSCDTIRFGNVLGQKRAFLIQNIFPISAQYIDATYIDRNTQKPVTISRKTERDIYLKAKKILRLVWRGYENLVFSDVLSIRPWPRRLRHSATPSAPDRLRRQSRQRRTILRLNNRTCKRRPFA